MFTMFTASTTDSPETTQTQDNTTPFKRSHTPDSSDAKRVKTEPVEDKQIAINGPVTVKQDPDVPGPSNDQVGSSSKIYCFHMIWGTVKGLIMLVISMRKIMYSNCSCI